MQCLGWDPVGHKLRALAGAGEEGQARQKTWCNVPKGGPPPGSGDPSLTAPVDSNFSTLEHKAPTTCAPYLIILNIHYMAPPQLQRQG